MTTTKSRMTTTEEKRRACDFCGYIPTGKHDSLINVDEEYDEFGEDEDYAEMLCDQCYNKNYYSYGGKSWVALGGVIDEQDPKDKEALK